MSPQVKAAPSGGIRPPALPALLSPYMTMKEVCDYVRYSLIHINRLVAEGKFPQKFKFGEGGRIAFLRSEVEAWAASKRMPNNSLPNDDDQ